MLFNSYIFILCFLPLTVIGYFILNKYLYGTRGTVGLWWLLFMSLWFYGYANSKYLFLILGSIFVNYLITCFIGKMKKNNNRIKAKIFLVSGIVFNFALLFYFKYYDFFIENMNILFHKDWNLKNIMLPLGISFFTFQQVSYVVDCYRQEQNQPYSFIEYASYVTFFPQLVAGPIVMHSELIPQLQDKQKKKLDYDNLSRGLYAFALGLAKKVLIADSLSQIVNIGFGYIGSLNTISAAVVMLSYTLQIYFDFSGYCDMAIGIASMFNIELPVNFNSPYKSGSISEFWDRWHITLTRFFTRYVYIPLGGNRKGKVRTYINTLVVFLLSGLWHGANWTFVLWGGLHGICMTTEKILKDIGLAEKWKSWMGKKGAIAQKFFRGCQVSLTFVLINCFWVLFRADSIHQAGQFFGRLMSGGMDLLPEIIENVNKLIEVRIVGRFGLNGIMAVYPAIPSYLILFVLLFAVFFMHNTQEKMKTENYNWFRSLVTIGIMVWCVISLSSISEFLYFNF